MKHLNKIMSSIGNVIGKLLQFNVLFRMYNFIYEHSSHMFVKQFVKFIPLPDKDNIWEIALINNKKVLTQIYKGQKLTSEFALSYKWHSPIQNITELLLIQNTGPDVTWIDIGSNLGLRSLLSLTENRIVYFIEPNRKLNEINKNRCKLNHFDNYTFIEVGLSDHNGSVKFKIDNSSYKSTIEDNVLTLTEIETIETIQIDTLDNLALQYNWTNANIKIDVEGHELSVLSGAHDFIQNYGPNIIVEVNEKGEHFKTFLEWVRQNDYYIFEIYDFKEGKYYRKVEDKLLSDQLKSNDFFLTKNKSIIEIIERYSIAM